MFERLRDSSDEKNKTMVESINEKLNWKKSLKMCLRMMIDLKRMKK